MSEPVEYRSTSAWHRFSDAEKKSRRTSYASRVEMREQTTTAAMFARPWTTAMTIMTKPMW